MAQKCGLVSAEFYFNFFCDKVRLAAMQDVQGAKKHMRRKICLVATVPVTVKAFLVPHIKKLAPEYDVTVVTNCSKEEFLDMGLPENVRFKRIPFVRNPHLGYDAVCLVALCGFFWKNSFNIVHSFMPKTGLLAMTAARLAKVPLRIHTFTGQVWATRKDPARWLLKMIDRFFASQACFVLADSWSQRSFLLKERVIEPNRSTVLLKGSISGVNPQRFFPDRKMRTRIRKDFFIAENDVVFLFLGRLKQDKGILELGKAFAQLQQTPKNIHLLIAGSDEESLQAHSLFNRMQNVYFAGHTQTPEQYMNAADVFCLPSRREGFGSVILEAACVGIPAVASRIYGVTDAVVEGKTGLLHNPGDVDDLCRCMNLFLENPGLRLTMGAAARHRAVTDFSEDRMTDALLHFYRRCNR